MFRLHFTDGLGAPSEEVVSIEVSQKYDFIFSLTDGLLNGLPCLNLGFIASRVVHIDYGHVFGVAQM